MSLTLESIVYIGW